MPELTPEASARAQIDRMFVTSGWAVQDKSSLNLSASRGVAVCELSFATGEPDYTLFVDGKAIGTTEAKPQGDTLTGVEEQSAKYVAGVPFGLPASKSPLPFCYETTGTETFFTNRLDPDSRSRRVFSFHRAETLLAWLNLIRDHIATAISIEPEDLELSPFNQRGGLGKAHQLFGDQLPKLLDELNTVLAA
jgi:type I restriction enzyme R subunit